MKQRSVLGCKGKRAFILKGMGILLLLLFLSACGANGEGEGDAHLPEAPIEVTFGTEPDAPHPAGQPITLYVKVMQEGEPVDDAEEVRFEIWRADEEGEKGGDAPSQADSGDQHGSHGQGDHHQGQESHSQGDMAHYQSDHPFYDATHTGDGVYTYEHVFDEPGRYYVMYHVTARGYHDMVKHELEITE